MFVLTVLYTLSITVCPLPYSPYEVHSRSSIPLWLHKFTTLGCHSATNYLNVPIFTPTSHTAVIM